MVLMELKVAEREDIMAARKDARSRPLTPEMYEFASTIIEMYYRDPQSIMTTSRKILK